jgi:hypothetical protein
MLLSEKNAAPGGRVGSRTLDTSPRLQGRLGFYPTVGIAADLPFVRISANLYNRIRGRTDVLAKMEDVAMGAGFVRRTGVKS